jgi:hypothetical protein
MAETSPIGSHGSKTIKCKIVKALPELGIVFGWASVTRDETGAEVWDEENDNIPTAVLEKAAYDFALNRGQFGVMHMHRSNGDVVPVGKLAEMFMLTEEKRQIMKAMLEKGEGLWVAEKVDDPAILQKILSGELAEFSIDGEGQRMAVR